MPKLVLDDVVARKLTQALNAEEDLVLTHQEARHVMQFMVDKPDPNIPPPGMRWTYTSRRVMSEELGPLMNEGWKPFGVDDGRVYLRRLTN